MMNRHKELFLTELRNKNLSKNTIMSYEHDLVDFNVYMKELSVEALVEIDNNHMDLFINKLKVSGKSQATIYRKITTIKRYYKFLMNNNVVENDPTSELRRPKIQREVPEYVSHEELNRLTDHIDLNTVIGQRDRMILELLYGTGIKVSELINLELDDYIFKKSKLLIGKREVKLNQTLNKLLHNYVNNIRKYFDKHNQVHVFLNYKGDQISRQGIWKNLKKYANEASLKDKVTLHTLRNSYAINRLNRGTDILDVKNEMGYQNVTSTHFFLQHQFKEA